MATVARERGQLPHPEDVPIEGKRGIVVLDPHHKAHLEHDLFHVVLPAHGTRIGAALAVSGPHGTWIDGSNCLGTYLLGTYFSS